MLRWLLFVPAFMPAAASAQAPPAPSPIQQRRDSLFSALRQAGVDTFCLYAGACRGYHFPEKTPCDAPEQPESAYLFWRQHRRTYRLYLGSCRMLPPVEIATDLWPYFDRHQQRLRTENIRPFYIRATPAPKRVRFGHDCGYAFQLFMSSDTIEQHIDQAALTKSIDHLGSIRRARNMNYRANRRSSVYQFLQLLVAATEAPPASRN